MHGTARYDTGETGLTSKGQHDEAFWLGIVLSFLAALPVLLAWTPQMTDYPSHLAGYQIMVDHGRDPFLTKYFTFKWEWTGNLGVELLMVPMAPLFGVERAGRIIVALIPVLTGLSIVAVARALQRRAAVGAILAFAMIWSPSLLMGFLNFSLSVALALFAFALWVRLDARQWLRRAAFIPIGFVVWLCHVSGWGVLGVMVFGYEWSRRRNWRDWRPYFKPWPLIFPLLPMLVGMGANSKVSYGQDVLDYKWGILYKAMRSYHYTLDVVCVSVVALAIFVAFVMRKIDGRLGWAALILLFLTLIVPRQIFGGDYADYRLSTTALLIACLAINWPAPRWGLALAALFFTVRLSLTSAAWYQDAQIARQMMGALDYVPQGAKVATAVAIPRRQWLFGPFEHFGSYAVVRRSAMENSNFALPDVHMLAMRERAYRFADPTQRILYASNQRVDLRKFRPAVHAEYLWYIGKTTPVALPDGARIIYSTPNSFLARLAAPPDLANPVSGS